MAIGLVKAGTLAVTATATVTPAFGQATTAGNLLIAVVVGQGTGSSGNLITTTASGWVKARNQGGSGDAIDVAIFYKPNCGAGEAAPTFTRTSCAYMTAELSEWSGADTSAPLDQTGVRSGVWGSGVASNTVCAAPDASDSDVAVAVAGYYASRSGTVTYTETWSPAGGTSGLLGDDGTTKSTAHTRAAYYLLNGNGGATADSIATTPTLSTGTMSGGYQVMATFKPVAAAAPASLVFDTRRGSRNNPLLRRMQQLPWNRRPSGILVPDQEILLPQPVI